MSFFKCGFQRGRETNLTSSKYHSTRRSTSGVYGPYGFAHEYNCHSCASYCAYSVIFVIQKLIFNSYHPSSRSTPKLSSGSEFMSSLPRVRCLLFPPSLLRIIIILLQYILILSCLRESRKLALQLDMEAQRARRLNERRRLRTIIAEGSTELDSRGARHKMTGGRSRVRILGLLSSLRPLTLHLMRYNFTAPFKPGDCNRDEYKRHLRCACFSSADSYPWHLLTRSRILTRWIHRCSGIHVPRQKILNNWSPFI